MTDRTALILDVDTGIDDSLALLYAAASPDAELVAATCVSGNVDGAPGRDQHPGRARAGRADRRRGRARARGPAGPRARDDAGDARPAGPRSRRAAAADRDRSRSATRSTSSSRRPAAGPGEIMLVTLGPLTNLALALEREPALPRLLKGYTLMGGAYGVSGNTTPTTEWNIHCDPDAAKIVFAAWAEAMAADPDDPAATGARPRRDRAGADPARRRGPARAARRQHPGRLDRALARRGPDARDPVGGEQPDRPLRRRRAALLHGVPRPLRRVLRRVHPRPAGRRGGARPHRS